MGDMGRGTWRTWGEGHGGHGERDMEDMGRGTWRTYREGNMGDMHGERDMEGDMQISSGLISNHMHIYDQYYTTAYTGII